ncbi:hypothetical protein PRZ48_004610 [Zasmidium cellare]|uniref:Uncharacterized protein n=1 Tax=Zasmidium cellare TaxID=395010 RepID=A0ABR0ER08_ZASCE|nr:hypothetical protein PRZ48_004610 [Zasmidium cellare]
MTQQVLAQNVPQEGDKQQKSLRPDDNMHAHAWNESSGAVWQNLTLTEADWSSVLNEFDFGMAIENSNELATHFSIATGQPQLDGLPS